MSDLQEFQLYGPQKLQQLQLAHSSTVLLYMRNDARDKEEHVKEIARKLRPEFNRLYISDDIKECFKLLNKPSAEDGLPSSTPVDLVILDFDPHSMKLLDTINKRSIMDKTKHLPLISTIVLLPLELGDSAADGGTAGGGGGGAGLSSSGAGGGIGERGHSSDAFHPKQMIANAGGCNIILSHNVSSKQMLYSAMDALYRRKLIETSYRDVKIVKSVSAKYPYFPIFSRSGTGEGEDGNDADDAAKGNGSRVGNPGRTVAGAANAGGDNASASGSTKSLHTMTDWTDSSSMLPEYVKEQRHLARNRKMGAGGQGQGQEQAEQQKGPSDRRSSREIRERHALDRMLLSSQREEGYTGGRSGGGGGGGVGDLSSSSLASLAPAGDDESKAGSAVQADDISYVSADSSPAVAMRKNATQRLQNVSLNTSSSAASQGRDQLAPVKSSQTDFAFLLNPRRRPKFDNSSQFQTSSTRRTTTRSLEDFSLDDEDQPQDWKNFYDKLPPSLQIEHTVGGLDRKQTQQHWKVLNTVNHADPSKAGKAGKGHGKKNAGGGNYGSMSGSLASSSRESATGSTNEQQQHAWGQAVARGPGPKDLDSSTKALKRMARDNAPDVQVHNLVQVELTHGKVTMGDRDMLETGLKLEQEGLNDQAILQYTRAGLHSKSPHLSKLFLGSIHFRLGKFMAALKYFSDALHLLEECRRTAHFNEDDYFSTNFNRGVTNFRVGNDEQGILDLEKAVSIKPDHLLAREVLSLANRRMGFYRATIEGCKLNKVLRLDQKIQADAAKAEEEAKKDEAKKLAAARRAFGLDGRGRDHGPGQGSTNHGGSRPGSQAASRRGSRQGLVAVTDTRSLSSLGGEGSLALDDQAATSLKTIYFHMTDPVSADLRGRKQIAKQQVIESESSGAMPGEALKAFKIMNGMPLDLYQGLFVNPSPLQAALAVVPEKRDMQEIDIISSTLRLVPFLRPVPDKIVHEIARCVEYRAVANNDELYAQNAPCEGVCFLLRGVMQARLHMESAVAVGGMSAFTSTVTGQVGRYEAVGYTDMLFHNPHSGVVRNLLAAVKREKEGGGEGEGSAAGGDAGGGAQTTSATTARSSNSGGRTRNALKSGVGGEGDYVGAGAVTDADLSDNEGDLDDSPYLPRALCDGMFTSYQMQGPCEMLLLAHNDFERFLYTTALDDFNRRLDLLKASRVFQGWKLEDMVRLARMGRMQTFRSGEVILAQGEKPDYCYFIVKGMCKSYKRPNKTEILDKKLALCRAKAERHDTKYAFHSGLRHTLTKSTRLDVVRSAGGSGGGGASHLPSHKHVTEAEVDRHLLGLQILRLEHELAKEKAHQARVAEEEQSLDEEKEDVTKKLVEVSTLQWPMLFGEACIEDPEKGFSRGTIIADTTCEIFLLHKIQVQTFRVDAVLLDHVTHHAVNYPADEALVESRERKETWEIARGEIVEKLRSAPKDEHLEPFRVTRA